MILFSLSHYSRVPALQYISADGEPRGGACKLSVAYVHGVEKLSSCPSIIHRSFSQGPTAYRSDRLSAHALTVSPYRSPHRSFGLLVVSSPGSTPNGSLGLVLLHVDSLRDCLCGVSLVTQTLASSGVERCVSADIAVLEASL